ncbi:hypothetical protein [Actinoplanes ianthinogenes]|uniref:hypothetical protein n=1 Tax=Actinoplanes ianthinogenes TaxID=122358 RepID=UPI001E448026|nr:hypothetical protein [Actinoplanes ianthinogenes]
MKKVTKPPRISRLSVEPRLVISKKRSKPFRGAAVSTTDDMLALPGGTVIDARMLSDRMTSAKAL